MDFTILGKNVESFLSGFLINRNLDLIGEAEFKTPALIFETVLFFLHSRNWRPLLWWLTGVTSGSSAGNVKAIIKNNHKIKEMDEDGKS